MVLILYGCDKVYFHLLRITWYNFLVLFLVLCWRDCLRRLPFLHKVIVFIFTVLLKLDSGTSRSNNMLISLKSFTKSELCQNCWPDHYWSIAMSIKNFVRIKTNIKPNNKSLRNRLKIHVNLKSAFKTNVKREICIFADDIRLNCKSWMIGCRIIICSRRRKLCSVGSERMNYFCVFASVWWDFDVQYPPRFVSWVSFLEL